MTKLEGNLYDKHEMDLSQVFNLLWKASVQPCAIRAITTTYNTFAYKDALSESTNLRELEMQIDYKAAHSFFFNWFQPPRIRLKQVLARKYEIA